VTTETDDSVRPALPTASATENRPAGRRRRSHAALGSRVVAGGLAVSGTIGLAGVLARRPTVAAAPPVRQALLTLATGPAKARPTKPTACVHVVGAAPHPGDGRVVPAAPAVGTVPVPSRSPARPSTSVALMSAPPPPAPAAAAPPQIAPPPAAPAPTSPPRPIPAPPVVVAPKAPPITRSHASPPPP